MTIKVLLTGFGPFLSYTTNPSGEIAKRLNGKIIGDAEIVGKVLQVEHEKSAVQIHEYIVMEKPDVIVELALGASKGCITLEKLAINTYFFRSSEGETEDRLYEDGPDSYFSTLPLAGIKWRLQEDKIPTDYSFTADTYVSNEVFYEIMRMSEKLGIRKAGMIHLPLSHEQVVDMSNLHYTTRIGIPSMDLETMERAVRLIVEESVKLDG
jgi:pyroglutamyl-peptidase